MPDIGVLSGSEIQSEGSRTYISAAIRLVYNRSLNCRGIEASNTDFEKLESLQVVPKEIINQPIGYPIQHHESN